MLTEEKWKIVRALAPALGVKRYTVYQWKARKAIPSYWHIPLIVASKGIIEVKDFIKEDDTSEE